jgi:hypothetical protein
VPFSFKVRKKYEKAGIETLLLSPQTIVLVIDCGGAGGAGQKSYGLTWPKPHCFSCRQ